MYLEKKSPDMLALETSFMAIKNREDVQGHLRNIQRVLSRHFDLNFTVSIVDNSTNEFFGMTIYPSRNVIESIIDQIVNNKAKTTVLQELWSKNKEWHLEIDSVLLYDVSLNTNPAEMVAVLLHEVGHVVHSNTIPERVNKVLRYEMLHLSYSMKKLFSWKKVHRLLDLVVVEACSSKNFHSARRKEVDADKFVVKMGYGDNLDHFIDKLVGLQGNRLVDRNEKDMERDVRSIVMWTIDNVSELEYRKRKLRTTLQTEIIQNPSRFVRGMIFDIKALFFGGADEDSYKELIREQYLIQEINQVVKEGMFDLFDKLGKVKKITQSDIDIIEVEMTRIQNTDDKIYVLDLIYDKLDRINAALELIAKKQNDKVTVSKDKLINYKNQLEKLRKTVLAIEIREKQYGVFINYPKGYEG
jgi:Peptidase family M48